ncbi:MAG: type IV pilus twitching motility protein PilT [Candidatus Sumerlaeia bacterium]|nr:type IV pilus twitching motility protein PilT [Candidatus Sumerlaeia bacterium]
MGSPDITPPRRPSIVPRPSAPATSKASESTDLENLLGEAVRAQASDLHLTRNMPPILRIDGRLIPMDVPALTAEECEKMVRSVMSPPQQKRFDEAWELDISVEFHDIGRFRVNIHRQRGTLEAAFRIVNDTIKPLHELGLPKTVEELARKNNGLIIVTGPTGSGKTTTLAAIIDQINHERQCMIITVEDPIEYIHGNHRAVIKQRELTSDTRSFVSALRHVLRQDPDVIVVGEMRDLETIQTALTAAETGHMVFSTLHTPDAVQTVDRIIDVFPPHQQEQVRIQLANTLQAVVAQQLIPIPGNQGRAIACEVMVATPAVRKTVRSGKTEQLMTIIQTSHEHGMISMDKSLKTLYLKGNITFDEAITRCKFPESFDQI